VNQSIWRIAVGMLFEHGLDFMADLYFLLGIAD
jgi:hypothetical protein